METSDRVASGLIAASALAALVLLILVLSANGAIAQQPMLPIELVR